METLFEQDIPSFVKDSPYLQSLLSNGPFPETGIKIPKGCAKQDLSINSDSDLAELLQTLRFWMVPEVLETCIEFLRFVFDPQNEESVLQITEEYQQTIPFAYQTAVSAPSSVSVGNKIAYAISLENIFTLKFLCEELKVDSTGGFEVAVGAGNIECMKYFHSRGEPLTLELTDTAIKHGQLVSLQWLHENGVPWSLRATQNAVWNGRDECFIYLLGFGLSKGLVSLTVYGVELLRSIVREGSLQCLEYMYSLGVVGTAQTMTAAAYGGHLPCLRFLVEHNCPNEGDICDILASYNYFDCLKAAPELGFVWNERTMTGFARNGNLEGMQYLREHGCPWDEFTCGEAAQCGHLECLKYAHENGCPWKDRPNSYPTYYVTIASSAAGAETADCLRYVVDQGVRLTHETFQSAAKMHRLHVIEYLISVKCPCRVKLNCDTVTDGNDVDKDTLVGCLRALLKIGCKWDVSASHGAARVGRGIVILRFVHENGCPWNARTCYEAAWWSLECLKYAHENGCPWDANTTRAAARGREEEIALACLQYAHENGCPWDKRTCRIARTRAVYEYAVAHGCPGAELSPFRDPAFQGPHEDDFVSDDEED